MFPSISLAQEIGLAVLLTAVLVWFGIGRMVRDGRSHRPQPGAPQALPLIPAQRSAAGHPMETVQLTEAEEQAFAGLVRTIPLH
ncbi:hypothetical protein ACIGD1_12870 [Streptomyces sp. NPDC085612]|uniref:hypothetical protein n=1 Tax=unclassified Streptomyces TaxID=2593676 RepID=UPI0037ABA377